MALRRSLRMVVPVAVAIGLSACGTRFQSPAATVDGHEISQGELKTEIDLALTDPRLAQQIAGPQGTQAKAELTRQALAGLIRREVASEYAQAHRLVVTAADIDKALQAIISQVGGRAQFDALIRDRGLSLTQVRGLLANQVLLGKIQADVVAALPAPAPSDAQARDQAFQAWLTDRVAHAQVSVNPRFGRFNRSTGEVLPITSTADIG
jgi:SurA N-terminal domain